MMGRPRSALQASTLLAALVVAAILLAASDSHAQSWTGSPSTVSQIPGQTGSNKFESTAPAATEQLGAISVPPVRTGPLAGPADRLYNETGISFNAFYLGEAFSNPGQGVRPDQTAAANEIRPGVDLDLGKIFGLRGGQIHIAESIFFLESNLGTPTPDFQMNTAGFFAADPPLNNKQRSYLTLLTYEQRLFHNTVDIEVGRLNANHYIELPNCTTALTCGDPIEMLGGGGAPPAYAFWGGRLRWDFTPKWWFQTIGVENNPRDTSTDGFTFSTQRAAGVKIIAAFSRHATFLEEPYPGNYELDLVYNTDSVSVPDNARYHHRGTASVLTREQQVIWRADGMHHKDAAPRNITLFGTISADPDKKQAYNYFLEGGAWYAGFWKSRPLDRIGLMVSWTGINPHELNFQRQLRVASGGPDVMTPQSEWSFQVDASFALTRSLLLQPYVQYDVNSDTFFNLRTRILPRDGWVVGATALFYLGRQLGLSHEPAP